MLLIDCINLSEDKCVYIVNGEDREVWSKFKDSYVLLLYLAVLLGNHVVLPSTPCFE